MPLVGEKIETKWYALKLWKTWKCINTFQKIYLKHHVIFFKISIAFAPLMMLKKIVPGSISFETNSKELPMKVHVRMWREGSLHAPT